MLAVGVTVLPLLLTPGELTVGRLLAEVERMVRRLVGRFAAAEGSGWLKNTTDAVTGFLGAARGGLFEPEQRADLGPWRWIVLSL